MNKDRRHRSARGKARASVKSMLVPEAIAGSAAPTVPCGADEPGTVTVSIARVMRRLGLDVADDVFDS